MNIARDPKFLAMVEEIGIPALSVEELRELNRIIVDEVRFRTEMRARTFNVGQSVTFDSKFGPVTGRVTKVNRKTVQVKATTGTLWNVTASLLKAA